MADKIRVVWLCHFSNAFVREHLELRYNRIIGFVKNLANKPIRIDVPEFANWITNGISEFERIEEVELHIVSPYPHLKTRIQEFTENGIQYHFFKNEEDSLRVYLQRRFFGHSFFKYKRNSKTICRIISKIRPEIVHLFGAENLEYSMALMHLPDDFITIIQLQTLMSDPAFKNNYPICGSDIEYRISLEKKIILKGDYIGAPVLKYRQIIHNEIKPNAVFLNTSLLLRDPIKDEPCEKVFDFVYFAANINKAADLAIEAFAIAQKRMPGIKLDIIGGYDGDYKRIIDNRIKELELSDDIIFEGKLPTHDDVLRQIRKSRFALLPLKVDITSGTIREAMASGIPVVTTDTGELGTQLLNIKRRNVLISRIGDHQAMANNMISLLSDAELADTLRRNAFQTRKEVGSNESAAKRYVCAYKACIENKRNNAQLPLSVTEL